jgi:hypothetical protein
VTRKGPAEIRLYGLYAKNGAKFPRADLRTQYFNPHPLILEVSKAVSLPLQDLHLVWNPSVIALLRVSLHIVTIS